MNDTKNAQTVNVSDRVGDFIIGTANVQARDVYLTLVLRNGLPFDMSVSETAEQAIQEHDAMFLAASIITEALAAQAEKGINGQGIPVKGNLLLN